ncbi:hypothetical protein BS17DRAFT_669419, partial [Gyrodon lividus]
VKAFFAECEQYCLNGVACPFFMSWSLSNPSQFLTPEALHHWIREFFDHDMKWCLNAVGEDELDFRFSILQSITSYCHFKDGVSKLKQVTGRAQCDMPWYIVALIANAIPPTFIKAICALADFRYISQAPVLDDNNIAKISDALEFHDNKAIIISSGAHCGAESKQPLKHWQILKLELMQSVAPSVSQAGLPLQWSADTTKHAHVTVIKDPVESMNNTSSDPQICRYLDHAEKCHLFEIAVSI